MKNLFLSLLVLVALAPQAQARHGHDETHASGAPRLGALSEGETSIATTVMRYGSALPSTSVTLVQAKRPSVVAMPQLFAVPAMLPSFGSGGTSTFTSFSGTISSAQMIDPYVPVDGTMNVTGALSVSQGLSGTSLTIGATTAFVQFNDAANRVARDTTTGGLIVKGAPVDGATAVAVRIAANDDYTTAGAKLLSVGDNAGTSYAEKVAIFLDGRILGEGTFTGTGANVILERSSDGLDLLSLNTTTGAATFYDDVTVPGDLSGTGTTGSGGRVNGVEIDYSTADTVATDTTPVSVTGISLAIDASDVYAVICQGTVFTALATAGAQMGLDLPASATQVATCHTGTTASASQYLSFTADDGFCANVNGLTTPGTPFQLYSKVTNSTNAGNIVLRIRSETTDDVTMVAGAKCEAKKIVDN